MTFIILAIVILLGIGAWFVLTNKSKFNLPEGKSIKEFILEKVEPKKEEEKPIVVFGTIPKDIISTTMPAQLPPVFSAPPALTTPEQPKIVNTPVTPVPAVEVKILKDEYPSVKDLANACDGYVYAVMLDGKSFHVGFGPADSFITKDDGSIIRGSPQEELDLKVEEEK